MPVKVEQINEYLFSDTVQSQKKKSGSDEISQGQYRGYPSSCSVKGKENLMAYLPAFERRLHSSLYPPN